MPTFLQLINRTVTKRCNEKKGRMVKIIDSPSPSVGVVIGTYAALPYVHLQLESRRRFWPDVPVLVHDDCSEAQNELRRLCERYGATLITTPNRLEHYRGDIQVFVAGLDWASQNNLEMLVKISRRFVICKEWVSELQALAFTTQYATYTNVCVDKRFPIRSECMAMHVGCWQLSGAHEIMRQKVVNYDLTMGHSPLEYWYYHLIKIVHQAMPLTRATLTDQAFPRGSHFNGSNWGGFGLWPLMGNGCLGVPSGVLWRHTHQPQSYLAQAQEWDIFDYCEKDFADANLGQTYGQTFSGRPRSKFIKILIKKLKISSS